MQKTDIEYLKHTWNPMAMLCTPTESPGCLNCWHRRMTPRLAGNSHFTKEERAAWAGTGPPVLREKELEAPIRLKKPSRIGVQFMGDLFHRAVEDKQIEDVFRITQIADQHTYIFLTKRPERMAEMFYRENLTLDFNTDNIWCGISASNQNDLDRWLPTLLHIPEVKQFVSLEPLLGPVDVSPYIKKTPEAYKILSRFYDEKGFKPEGDQPERSIPRLDGIVAGGESGPGARPSHPDWFRKVRDQCQEAGVPFTFKQWGKWGPLPLGTVREEVMIIEQGNKNRPRMYKVGKKAAGRELDGRIHDAWPEED